MQLRLRSFLPQDSDHTGLLYQTGIMPYYKQVKKVRANGKAYLKFHRLVDIQRVNRNNWYFEKREEGVYRNHVKMKEILTKLIKKHHQSHVIEGMECDGYFKQKSGSRHVKN